MDLKSETASAAKTQTRWQKQLRRRLPLQTVLTIPFVLQTVATAAVVGYLSYENGQKSVRDLAQNLEQEVNERISDRLDSYLAIPPQINRINLDAYELGRLDLLDFKTAGQHFWQQRQVFGVSVINFATLKGEYIGVVDYGQRKLLIEEIPLNTQGTSYLYTTNAQGKRIKFAGKSSYNPFNEAWFSNTLKEKKPNWSEIYNWDGYPEILSLSANYPVYDRQARMFGVLGVDLELTEISNFLARLKVGKSGKAFIIERSGLLVASSVAEPAFLTVNGKTQRLPAIKSKDIHLRETTAALEKELGNFAKLKGDRQFSLKIAGKNQYVQIAPWSNKQGLDWLVVLVIPESDFMGQIYANNQRTMALSAIALLIAVILGILTARRIAYPILSLSRASESLAQAAQKRSLGDNLERYRVASNIQELETLSHSFYQMGAQLQDAFSKLEAANEELEQRVAQRTLDLQQANAKITELNLELQSDNLRMRAELEVAHRLQQMMLPQTEELQQLENLDIACFMQPAQEVGGDYYDAIEGDRHLTIAIGDVTGHGLESGVLAILAQTALRTLLAAKQQEPMQLLNTLNQVLYTSAQRLSPGKHMTFGLFQYRDGLLHISGQHEDVLIFRENGAVERIDTIELGMPLGMLPDIKEFVGCLSVNLEPGDGVVLYSDGIPEAEGQERSLYKLERLIATVRQHWSKSATEIQQLVIEDVRSHIGDLPLYDDITLVVLKQT